MRFVSMIVAAVGLLGCGGAELKDTDERGSLDQEIVGGREARPGSSPWIVSLQQNGHHFCGGTILHQGKPDQSSVVLTAAHCVYEGTTGVEVVAGAHDLLRPPSTQTKHRVKHAIYHPQYNPDTNRNDIAIVQLETPIKFAVSKQPVGLPPQDEVTGVNVLMNVAGWGLTSEGSADASNLLMETEVPTISDQELQKAYQPQGLQIFPQEMLGAGYKAGGRDACQGDSGGPLILNQGNKHILRGVVSFGVGCARAGLPGVYTEVSHYISWIQGQLKLAN